MTDVDANTLRLMRRMTAPPATHERFVGEAVDMAKVDALALGDLWTLANATETHRDHRPVQGLAADTARKIRELGQDREPAFRGAACRDYLAHLADEAEGEPEAERGRFDMSWPLKNASFALQRCVDLTFDGLGTPAERLLNATPWRVMPHVAVALARLVDAPCERRVFDKLATDLAASPLLLDEVRAVGELDLSAHLVVADVADPYVRDDPDGTKATRRLSMFPGYAAFAEAALAKAAERVRQIHATPRSYAADKAFTLHESAVIARAARTALERDEAWLPAVLDELFRNVSVAPTSAKTVPSQSVAIALGHAVEAFPTPEALATLRQVLRDVRHAGVAKKLQRNVRGAERGLATRPGIALRLPPGRPPTKPQLAAVARCLEAGFETALTFPFDEWRDRLAEHKQAKALTGVLVWRLSDPSGAISVMPVADRSGLALQDVDGADVAADGDRRIALWHPSEADDAERKAWRDRIVASRLVQPFKQVFREHYVLPPGDLARGETTIFAGHAMSIQPLLGLARRQGWRIDYDCLVRPIGGLKVTLVLSSRVFPGASGWTTIEKLGIWRPGPRKDTPAAFGDLSSVSCSEVLRAVDLLVSTSGFALAESDRWAPDDPRRDAHLRELVARPLGPMAEMRKHALAHALVGREGMDAMTFDGRHLRLGRYAIHLATGRVTRDGDPVDVELPGRPTLAAVPWLPYDERLLETIALTALQIGRLAGA